MANFGAFAISTVLLIAVAKALERISKKKKNKLTEYAIILLMLWLAWLALGNS